MFQFAVREHRYCNTASVYVRTSPSHIVLSFFWAGAWSAAPTNQLLRVRKPPFYESDPGCSQALSISEHFRSGSIFFFSFRSECTRTARPLETFKPIGRILQCPERDWCRMMLPRRSIAEWWPMSSTALPYIRCNLTLGRRPLLGTWDRDPSVRTLQLRPALAFYFHPTFVNGRGVLGMRHGVSVPCPRVSPSRTYSRSAKPPSGAVPLRNLKIYARSA